MRLQTRRCKLVQLISDVYECVREIYTLENVVFCIAVYGVYKPYISVYANTECSNATEVNCSVRLGGGGGGGGSYPGPMLAIGLVSQLSLPRKLCYMELQCLMITTSCMN